MVTLVRLLQVACVVSLWTSSWKNLEDLALNRNWMWLYDEEGGKRKPKETLQGSTPVLL